MSGRYTCVRKNFRSKKNAMWLVTWFLEFSFIDPDSGMYFQSLKGILEIWWKDANGKVSMTSSSCKTCEDERPIVEWPFEEVGVDSEKNWEGVYCFFHRSNTAENLPGMWMFFDSLGSSEYGLTTYHFLGWDFRENVSRTFVAWKSRLLLRNMEASLTSWGVQVSAVPATPSRFVHHVVRFASCLGWYRWWFRNPKQPPDMHKNPVNNDRFSISTGVGFLPSTVLLILLLMLMSLENSKIHQNRPGMFFFESANKNQVKWRQDVFRG